MIEKIYEIKEKIISYKYYLIGISVFILTGLIILISFNFNSDDNEEFNNNLLLEQKEEKVDKCMVDIKGYINNPGLYEINCDKRVMDVITMAGGLMENSDTSVINLSKKITDGMVIVIYSKDEVMAFTKTKEKEKVREEKCKNSSVVVNEACITKSERVDSDSNSNVIINNSSDDTNKEVDNTPKIISINTASKEELMTLKGIGEAKALAIIAYREEHGSFTSINEIMNIKGIGEKMFEKIKDFITL